MAPRFRSQTSCSIICHTNCLSAYSGKSGRRIWRFRLFRVFPFNRVVPRGSCWSGSKHENREQGEPDCIGFGFNADIAFSVHRGDLATYPCAGAANRATGITIASGRQHIVVRGGCISNYLTGIYAEKGSRDIRLSGLSIEGSTFRGALLEADDVTFSGNVINRVGGTSVYEDASTMGLDLRGDDCQISENLVSDVLPVGVGDADGIAVGGNRCTLRDNVIVNRTRPEWGRTYGMVVNAPASLVQNVSVGQTYGFALTAGIQPPAGNIAYGEVCGTGAMDCPDNVSLAMKRMDPAVPPSLFIVGRAFHRAKDYPSAAIYYLAAAKRGIAEGERIVKRHLQAGYITKEDRREADRKSDALLAGVKPAL
jgi:hypothetical protein